MGKDEDRIVRAKIQKEYTILAAGKQAAADAAAKREAKKEDRRKAAEERTAEKEKAAAEVAAKAAEKAEADAVIEKEKIYELIEEAKIEDNQKKKEKPLTEAEQKKKNDERVKAIEFRYAKKFESLITQPSQRGLTSQQLLKGITNRLLIEGLTPQQLAVFKMRMENRTRNMLDYRRRVFLDVVQMDGKDSPDVQRQAQLYADRKSDVENATNSSPKKLAMQELASVEAEIQGEVAITRFEVFFHKLALKEVTGVEITSEERKELEELQKLANAANMAIIGEPAIIPNKATNAREAQDDVKKAEHSHNMALVEAELLQRAKKKERGILPLFVETIIIGGDSARKRLEDMRNDIIQERNLDNQLSGRR